METLAGAAGNVFTFASPVVPQVDFLPSILYVNSTTLRQNVLVQLEHTSNDTISIELKAPSGWDGKPLAALARTDLKIEPPPQHEARRGFPLSGLGEADPCMSNSGTVSCQGANSLPCSLFLSDLSTF